ncbi:hypothetical protein CRG98_001402 [Punica granatum]|uniref:Protein-serine/threonine phosphatase n=1 Tax=Punica granatum TaxID=22663 RepID=A0A2I0LC34_PUNGR|nr:hypothetical protein CRG98_001402 [Punica granatum]
MEDDVVVQLDGLEGFTFIAVFDGHGGFSVVNFLRLEAIPEEDESSSTAIVMFLGNDSLIISHVGVHVWYMFFPD